MTALVCGSYAYDHIMVFHDYFKHHILPDKIHMLNVSFLVPDMRREFGGCAGNIAYNLKMLGGDVTPMATVGIDFAPYATWLESCGINKTHIKMIDNTYTGQAFITTDQDDNQITAFHPGAMNESHQNDVRSVQGVTIGMVSPDGKQGMMDHARQFHEAGIPFVFDPGQGMPMFNGDELKTMLQQANWLTVNDYEMQMFLEKTGMTPADVINNVDALIITLGGKGAEIHTRNKRIEIPAVQATSINDPTGCGDAFRGGLLYGMMNNMDWEVTGRIASLMGSIKIERHGTQNHTITKDGFYGRFKEIFGISL